jgi:hypothetical protein
LTKCAEYAILYTECLGRISPPQARKFSSSSTRSSEGGPRQNEGRKGFKMFLKNFATVVVFFATSVVALGAKQYLVPGGDPENANRQPEAGEEVVVSSHELCDKGWGTGTPGKRVEGCYPRGTAVIRRIADGEVAAIYFCGNTPTGHLKVAGKKIPVEVRKEVVVKEVVKLVEKPADTPPPPPAPKPEVVVAATSPAPPVQMAAATPCVNPMDLVRQLQGGPRPGGAKASCTPQGAVEASLQDMERYACGPLWLKNCYRQKREQVLIPGAYGYGVGGYYGGGGGYPAVSYPTGGGVVGGRQGGGNYNYNTNTGPAWGRDGNAVIR